MRVALLVGGPAHGCRVRADLLDPQDSGALHIMWTAPSPQVFGLPVTVGPLTYWRRDGQPADGTDTVWDHRP